MTFSDRRRGHYLGTEIDEKWWRRETADKILARGNGEGWIEDGSLRFLRLLTRDPIVIPLRDVVAVKTGRWHAGRWAAGAPVVKLIWHRGGRRLSSGFVFSSDPAETRALVAALRAAAADARANG